ncbi:hypothetical protein SARC_09266 [Sphaeroforma arctica JP610]|uniref:Uncharacterized protein n=1 Tax=Sphaeroforma arctica JP610 TaxID=667725 RepID=A0A0L0FP63_9EUKA|nr:hypothetical protein SARC_09266 [Sphaeroforma arctica JP610]KNC78296.1 hypothetical protein SARC_09266 [Sphaeroforma arctica JP610]|eukprot:XP_014152198.1 hypothetical protein SARC_09266 [Sphaeroforma arctica JP610]
MIRLWDQLFTHGNIGSAYGSGKPVAHALNISVLHNGDGPGCCTMRMFFMLRSRDDEEYDRNLDFKDVPACFKAVEAQDKSQDSVGGGSVRVRHSLWRKHVYRALEMLLGTASLRENFWAGSGAYSTVEMRSYGEGISSAEFEWSSRRSAI